MEISNIDWSRMAEPQACGYDSDVVLSMASEGGYIAPKESEGPRFLDGTISLRRDNELWFPGDCVHADVSHPNVRRAESLLRLWPEVEEQCRRLLHRITLFQTKGNVGDNVVGSICGPGTEGFGSIAVTIDHHVGFAEGIVHEMAHHKLRALGVDFESAVRLLANEEAQLFPSPIRYDCLRPISAVLHAQYSYTYILQLDLHILQAAFDDERDRSIIRHSIAVIAPKIEFGKNVLKRNARTDTYGTRFLNSLYAWTDRILLDCTKWLDLYGVRAEPFEHPIAKG